MSIEILFLVIYFVAMAGIGVWAMKRGKQDAEGFLYPRSDESKGIHCG